MDRVAALTALTAPGEPYELHEVEMYGHVCRAFRHAPPTLRHLYDEARGDLPFIQYEDEVLTFEDAWRQAARLANLLGGEYGVVVGERVAISMRNYPEWIIGFMASTSIGAVAVAMNALWTPDEMAYGLSDSGAKVLLCDEERLERLARCTDEFADLAVLSVRASEDHGTGARDLGMAIASCSEDMPMADIHPNDDATIFYTSGSTGHPKGAVSCHRNIISALLSWELDARSMALMSGVEFPVPDQQPATLLAVPLFHATGSHAVYLSSYRAQRRIVSMYKWDVALATELIEREGISSVTAPAAMTGDLVAHARLSNHDLSSLLMVGGGGAPRAPEQVRNIDQQFDNARPNTGWGMTETNAIGTGIAGDDYAARPESSGRCSAVLDIRIVDEGGGELPTGSRGELQIRGASVIRGYWNRPDANAETFVDGWLRTGDVAYLDEEGFVFIVDRIKDLVIRGGENIGCGAVEAALLEHPAVSEASVYGVPDERLGEEVGATVYSAESVSEDELRVFLQTRLARFEIPRYLRFADSPLPRTASGKILKRQLRGEAIDALAES
ncbi:MAG: class I adenylate-forming enzyme family protein [Pseudomonadales bacterium]|jgi:long-chain acyl-CoA synthetase|nr:class I adenylate-forming enzyme family protein [Pseudomonadales bacterium]MDP6472250.1 class I adenylate-forming enzyme family protein [Pseudomonadales bacterium]MDP6826498.1 class I adenylate-forming enzyme family protein [Pseudomonadales bacterium]MDP6970683.1 class I adenylate-forming enzyme family protein [Pseudomonadales bacterium]|tara:strand:+ start:65 stop:1738 length:1674 start_codon:yes stop_codon:yes gene_type:complete